MPNDFDDGYQVYANGRYIGQFGHFLRGPCHDLLRPVILLPAAGARSGWRDRAGDSLLHDQRHPIPVLRMPAACTSLRRWGWPPPCGLLQAAEDDANQHYYFGVLLQSLLFLLVVPLPLWAWLQNRNERTYLWLFFSLAFSFLRNSGALSAICALSCPLGRHPRAGCSRPVSITLWAMFWWHWFGLREKRWIPRAVWVITGAEMLALLCVRLPTSEINLVPRLVADRP